MTEGKGSTSLTERLRQNGEMEQIGGEPIADDISAGRGSPLTMQIVETKPFCMN